MYSGVNQRVTKATSVEQQITRMNSVEKVRINLALLGDRKATLENQGIPTNAGTETKSKLEVGKANSNTPKKGEQGNNGGSGTAIKSLQELNGATQSNNFLNPSLRETDTANIRRKSFTSTSGLKIGPDVFVSLKTGSIAEHYKVGDLIGEGAFGQVLIATHRLTGITRAMKKINKRNVHKSNAEKFFEEVNILRDLDHPNILKLYELYQDGESYYLITEYLNGGELFERIQEMHNFTEKKAAEYMKQILSAVVYLHEKNIVHRDLKPENLLLDSKKHDASLKLIDFGTAQLFEPGTKMSQKHGTPYYIAPEVINKSYDEKCDIWSCGIIMYILLCGYPPFNGKTDPEIFAKITAGKFEFDRIKQLLAIVNEAFITLAEDWSKISPEAKNLIKKMLTYKPEERISARDALNDVWLHKNLAEVPLNKKVLDNLGSFQSQNKLKQAILTLIVTQISTHQEKEELKKTFQQLDKDGNGLLTKQELVEGYAKIFGATEASRAEALRIFNEVDINGSGEIDYSEFIMAAMNKEKLLSAQKISQAFAMFDQNGDGYITREELVTVMGGIEMPDDEWNQIIQEVDANGDGRISKDEFIALLQNFK